MVLLEIEKYRVQFWTRPDGLATEPPHDGENLERWGEKVITSLLRPCFASNDPAQWVGNGLAMGWEWVRNEFGIGLADV